MQVGDTGPAESTRRGNLQRVGLLFLGSRDSSKIVKSYHQIYVDHIDFQLGTVSIRTEEKVTTINEPLIIKGAQA